MTLYRGGFQVSKEQADVVDHVVNKPVTVVSAGAGSGKTYTMIATVLHLLETNVNLRIDDFILITFTNKAADEMRERLNKAINKRIVDAEQKKVNIMIQKWYLQKEYLANTFIGTIHGFCSMILKIFGYEKYVAHDKENIMARRYFIDSLKESMEEGYIDAKTSILFQKENLPLHELEEYIISIYENIRNLGRNTNTIKIQTIAQPEDDDKELRVATIHLIDKLHNIYNKTKKELGGIDSNDLLKITVDLINLTNNKKNIGDFFNERYNYLFVDEFQDTDRLQKDIIQSIIPNLKGVLVVGDIKQSIYGFRGAEHTILQEIADENNTEIKHISISRRPTKYLHEVQYTLFKNMSSYYPFLSNLTGLPDNPRVPNDNLIPFTYINVHENNIEARARVLIDYINELLNYQIDHVDEGVRKIKYSDICILFRSNSAIEKYSEIFNYSSIPYKIDTGGSFFKKPEIINCYYMLQAIIKYPNDLALDLVTGSPFLPRMSTLPLISYSSINNPMSDWLSDDPEAHDWYKGMMSIKKKAKYELVPKLLKELYDFTRVKEFYAEKGDYQAVANLEKLISWSRQIMHSEALTLQQFIDRMKVAILTKEDEDEAELPENIKDEVYLSTIHSAKGLEYPIIIIPEMQKPVFGEINIPKFIIDKDWGLDVCFPDNSGMSHNFQNLIHQTEKKQFDEEARIFYVAITRAQNTVCFIGNNSNRMSEPYSKYWSWRDEILRVKDSLESVGEKRVMFIKK